MSYIKDEQKRGVIASHIIIVIIFNHNMAKKTQNTIYDILK